MTISLLKSSHIINLMTPPKNLIIDQFLSFFVSFLSPVVLSKSSIKKILKFLPWQRVGIFLRKKRTENMLRLWRPTHINCKFLKSDIVPGKTLPMLR
jgi:hypothetical protein